MAATKLIKLKGLSGKQIAVDPDYVVFLEEADCDGKAVCNVHTQNGKWITAGLSLEEVDAALKLGNKEYERTVAEERALGWAEDKLEMYRKQAELKRRAQIEVNAVLMESALHSQDFEKVGHTIEERADGTRVITVTCEPKQPVDGIKPEIAFGGSS